MWVIWEEMVLGEMVWDGLEVVEEDLWVQEVDQCKEGVRCH